MSQRVRELNQNELSVFFKDDWKVHRDLTLNLGIRWDYYGVPWVSDGLIHDRRRGTAFRILRAAASRIGCSPARCGRHTVDIRRSRFTESGSNAWRKTKIISDPQSGFPGRFHGLARSDHSTRRLSADLYPGRRPI